MGSGDATEPRERSGVSLKRGDRLGRFVIGDLLGSGGMGVVYGGVDPQLHRKVALKLLRPKPDDLKERAARLAREAQALARLSDPRVVQIYEVGVAPSGDLFLAMELIDGMPLDQWLVDEHTWKVRLRALIDAGRGLAAAHRRGIVHRDFKPSNVMVLADGRAKILDFGLACGNGLSGAFETTETSDVSSSQGKHLTRVGMVVGTPLYMAPEQHRTSLIDARADQFSFCAVLFETLTSQRAFSGRTPRHLLEAKLRSMSLEERPQQIPRRVWQVIRRGLEPDPRRRWPDMDALLDCLECTLSTSSIARSTRIGVLLSSVVLCGIATPKLPLRAWGDALRAMGSASSSPSDPENATRPDELELAPLREQLLAAEAGYRSGAYASAFARVRDIAARGGASLHASPLHAPLALLEGRLHHRLGHASAARTALERAFYGAREHRVDDVAADAALELALLLGRAFGHPEQGLRWVTHARAEIERLRDPIRTAQLEHVVGVLHQEMGRHREALEAFESALAKLDEHGGASRLHRARTHASMGLLHLHLGDTEAAISHLEQCLSIERAVLGLRHPATAETLLELALARLQLRARSNDHSSRARGELDLARAIALETYDAEHPLVSRILGARSRAYLVLGDIGKARQLSDEVADRLLVEADPSARITWSLDRARIEAAAGHHATALRSLERARELIMDSGEDALLGRVLTLQGRILARIGRVERARSTLEDALEVERRTYGWKSLRAAAVHDALGAIEEAAYRWTDALRHYDVALQYRQGMLKRSSPELAMSQSHVDRMIARLRGGSP